MHKPLVPLRKPGKLPYRTHKLQYDLEYGQAELHVHIDGFEPGASVLLVDDLLATGGTLEAGCKLIEQAGGRCRVLCRARRVGVPRRPRKVAAARGVQFDAVLVRSPCSVVRGQRQPRACV